MSSLQAEPGAARERWVMVPLGWLRIVEFGPTEAAEAVVLLPGLCLPRYTMPSVRRMASLGLRCLVVDALAWRARARRVPPTVPALGAATADWLAGLDGATSVVLVGHSTGAQVALEAGLRMQDQRKGLSVLMAGPTFRPEHRKVHRLVGAALVAYRHDPPGELTVVRDLTKVRLDVLSIVQSARRHEPESRVGGLRVPLTLTAGEGDTFAPARWLTTLAVASGGPARVAVLPGSHNNLFTHPDAFAGMVTAELSRWTA